MSINTLPDEYRQVFEKLKAYVNSSSQGGLKNQPINNIEAFAHHYLVALGTMSRMRANPELKPYLPACQQLLVEANLLLYPEESVTFARFWRYIWQILPAQMWQNRWFYLASTGLSVVAAVIAFLIVNQNFEMASVFISSDLRGSHELESYLFSEEAQQRMLTHGRDASAAEKSLFAVALMNNNIRVAINCFATGILFAIPTVYMLILNGLMLGTFPALFLHGDLVGLGAWLLPHGVPEIGAIFLAGGAGLKIGFTELQPSPEPLGKRLRAVLKNVSGTVLVCTFLLIWAGLVESFVRQSDLSYEARYLIAGFSVIPFILLFLRGFIADRQLKAEAGAL